MGLPSKLCSQHERQGRERCTHQAPTSMSTYSMMTRPNTSGEWSQASCMFSATFFCRMCSASLACRAELGVSHLAGQLHSKASIDWSVQM